MDTYLIQCPFLTLSSAPQICYAMWALLSLAKSRLAFKALHAPCFYATGFSKCENGKAQFRGMNTGKEMMGLNITITSITILTEK